MRALGSLQLLVRRSRSARRVSARPEPRTGRGGVVACPRACVWRGSIEPCPATWPGGQARFLNGCYARLGPDVMARYSRSRRSCRAEPGFFHFAKKPIIGGRTPGSDTLVEKKKRKENRPGQLYKWKDGRCPVAASEFAVWLDSVLRLAAYATHRHCSDLFA